VEGKRSGANAKLVLAMVFALGMFPLLPLRAAWAPLACVLAGLTLASAHRRDVAAMHLGTFCTFLLIALLAFGSMKLWPLPPALAVGAYLIVTRKVPALAGRPAWFTRGRIDRGTVALMVASTLVSSLALVSWFVMAKPDYTPLVGTLFPRLPVPVLFCGVVAFAMLNAAMEEIVYRGLVQGALEAAIGPSPLPVILQAVVFGIVHVGGFPRGLAGMGLATLYGLMMGMIRRRAGGLLAPWIAHVATDIAIGAILLKALFGS